MQNKQEREFLRKAGQKNEWVTVHRPALENWPDLAHGKAAIGLTLGDKFVLARGNGTALLKIAYCSLALYCGESIFDSRLDHIRDTIKANDPSGFAAKQGTRSWSPTDTIFHGLALANGVDGGATVRVVLFGQVVFDIDFPSISLKPGFLRFAYQHDLETNEEESWL